MVTDTKTRRTLPRDPVWSYHQVAIQFKPSPMVGRSIWTTHRALQECMPQDNRECDSPVAWDRRSSAWCRSGIKQSCLELSSRYIQLPVLTPNAMLHINPSYLPESPARQFPDKDLRKRAKFLLKCREAMWKRWTSEYMYVRSLRVQHRQAWGKQTLHSKVGDVVITGDSSENRNHWNLAVVTHFINGRDDIVRAARLKSSKETLERAIQHLFSLELACVKKPGSTLNPAASEFIRPRTNAATAAALRMQEIITDYEQSGTLTW